MGVITGVAFAISFIAVYWVIYAVCRNKARSEIDLLVRQAEAQESIMASAFFVGRYKQISKEWGFDIQQSLSWIENRMEEMNLNPKQKLKRLAIQGGNKPAEKSAVLPYYDNIINKPKKSKKNKRSVNNIGSR